MKDISHDLKRLLNLVNINSSYYCFYNKNKSCNISNHEPHSCECSQMKNHYPPHFTSNSTYKKHMHVIDSRELEREARVKERDNKESFEYSFPYSL